MSRSVLRAYVETRLTEYPYSEPHPETVEAISAGVEAMIALSNARPERYASEPWLKQSTECHLEHARDHALTSWKLPGATTDLGQPEAAHAMLRLAFSMHAMKKTEMLGGVEKESGK